MNIAHILLKAYRLHPDRTAVSIGSKPLYTYRSFYKRVCDLATCMTFELSLSVGDRVAIVMPNHPEYLVIRYAAWYAGLSVVPINAKLHVREINYMLKHSGSRVCFVSSRLQNEVFKNSDLVEVIDVDSASYQNITNRDSEIEMVEVERDALAWLFYTSGTTGNPKGVMITHENMLVGAMSYLVDVDDISSEDSIIHAAPLSHGSGFYDLPHVMRCANQVIPASGQFNPSEILALIQDWAGVTMFLAPTMVKRIVQSQETTQSSLQGLKTVVYGGGPMYFQDIKSALDV